MVFSIIPPGSLWWLYALLLIGAVTTSLAYRSMSRQSQQPDQKKRWVLKLRFQNKRAWSNRSGPFVLKSYRICEAGYQSIKGLVAIWAGSQPGVLLKGFYNHGL